MIYVRISFSLNILRTNRQNFTKFHTCIHIDKIYVGIVTCHLLLMCSRVMPLIFQNLVPLNILEQMDRISPNFVYAFILTRSRLGLLHVIFCFFVGEL